MTRGKLQVSPPVESEEHFASWHTRARALNRVTDKAFSRTVFGRMRCDIQWSIPCGLSQFTETVGVDLGYSDVGYWLRRHTVAPFWCAGLTEDGRASFVRRVLASTPGPRKPILPIERSEWFIPCPVLCPACDDENVEKLGFSYVPRTRLLPFLTRCEIHGERLSAFPRWKPSGRGRPESILALPGRAEAGCNLSRRGGELVNTSEDLLARLGSLVRSRGYTTSAGRLKRGALNDLLFVYSRGRSEHPGLDRVLSSPTNIAHLLRTLESKRARLHPFVADQLIQALEQQPVVQEQLVLERELRKDKRSALAAALCNASTVTQAAREADVCVTTATVAALAAGVSVALRPKRLKPLLRKQIEASLASMSGLVEVAGKHEVSLSTVYRVLNANPKLGLTREQLKRGSKVSGAQMQWLAGIEAHPELSTTELRRLMPATYALLYRNDHKWLAANLRVSRRGLKRTAPSSRTPVGADEALTKQLRLAAKRREEQGGARKDSETALATIAGRGRRRIEKSATPGAHAAIQECSESLEEYVVRRLLQAIKDLQKRDVAAVPWRVVREARLRPATVARSGICVQRLIYDARAYALGGVVPCREVVDIRGPRYAHP